jgi:glycosyltransferase involved in cell wall biosynthesis
MHKITIGISQLDISNLYIQYLIKSLKTLGADPIEFNPRKINSFDYILFNWFENIKSKIISKQFLQFMKKIIILTLIILKRKKIILTLHNKQQHRSGNSSKLSFVLSMLLLFILKNISYKIIIHSKSSRKILTKSCQKKAIYVPHPNLISAYGTTFDSYDLTDGILRILFLGEITPYKNIDILIQAIKELSYTNIKLSIAGKISNEYKSMINKLIGDTDYIQTNFNYIPDHDIPRLISQHHLLIVPFDLESYLNSSTIILAFSYKRTVICSEIGTVLDLENKNMYFGYSYRKKTEHKEKLKECLVNIHQKYSNNFNSTLNMGLQCYNFLLENNSVPKIAESLSRLFYQGGAVD